MPCRWAPCIAIGDISDSSASWEQHWDNQHSYLDMPYRRNEIPPAEALETGHVVEVVREQGQTIGSGWRSAY